MISKIAFFFLLLVSLSLGQSANNIRIVDNENLDSLISNRNGKSLLVNIWATWCIPCREEFPDLNKIALEFKEQLDLVGLSVDFTEDIDEKIIPFLKENNIDFPIVVNGFRKDEDLINYFHKEWGGAIPVSIFYNANGEKIEFIEGKHDYTYFRNVILKHLEK